MSTPKRYLRPEVYQALAPQYVSGLLRGKARVRFIYLMQQHSEIREAVQSWERKLDGLNDHLNDIEPEPALFDALQTRITPDRSAHSDNQFEKSGFIQGIFSRWWMGAGGLLASLLFASLLLWQNVQTPAQINYVAVLENANGNAQWIATSSKETRKLKLDLLGELLNSAGRSEDLSEDSPDGHSKGSLKESMVLWAISKEDGSYYRFAEVADQAQKWIKLNDEAWQKIKTAHSLVITLESDVSVGKPEGLVVAKGLCVQINYDKKKPA